MPTQFIIRTLRGSRLLKFLTVFSFLILFFMGICSYSVLLIQFLKYSLEKLLPQLVSFIT